MSKDAATAIEGILHMAAIYPLHQLHFFLEDRLWQVVINATRGIGTRPVGEPIRQRQPVWEMVGLNQNRPTFFTEVSTGCIASSARVRLVEDPSVGKPHAGICARVAG